MLIDLDGTSGKLVPSKRFQGYVEFQPSEDERLAIEAWLGNEIQKTLDDYKPVWQAAVENIDVYKHKKMDIGGGKQILPSPLARIAADQIIASTYNSIIRPKPILSVEPYFPQTYQIMMPVDMGQGQTATVPVDRDGEQVAMTWELGYEFLLRERINFPKILQQVCTDTVTIDDGCWLKVCFDPQTRVSMEPTQKGIFVDLSDKREMQQAVGDGVKWKVLPIFNVIRPRSENDIQASPWMAELSPMTPDDLLLDFYRGEYPCLDEAEAGKLAEAVTDCRPAKDNSLPSDLSWMKCPVALVWFYRDVKVKSADGGKPFIKRLSLMGYFHHGENKLMSCFRNPYDHQFRPYVPCMQIPDPHELAGSCSVGIVKYHQRVKTQLIGNEMANAASANNMSFFADPDTEAYEYLLANPILEPNAVIPKKENEYVEAWRKGQAHESLLPMIQYTDADAMRAVNLSDYKTGSNIPGRTAAATVSQILEQGAQQPLIFLRSLNDSFVQAIKLDLRTRRQYYPQGETFHVKDPVTSQILEVLFQFPVEDAIDNFRFALTAADEGLAKEHEMPQLMALLNVNQQRADFVAKVAGPLSNPQLLSSQAELLVKILASDQAIMDRIVSLTRTDIPKFDYTDAIQKILKEREAVAQQAQMAAGQPPQPQIKVSLSGQLTPQQEAEAAAAQGFGGQNAQGPQSGGAVPGPAIHGQGPVGPPQQPGIPSGMAGAQPPPPRP